MTAGFTKSVLMSTFSILTLRTRFLALVYRRLYFVFLTERDDEKELRISRGNFTYSKFGVYKSGMGSSRTVLDLQDKKSWPWPWSCLDLEKSIYFTQYCIHSRCAGHWNCTGLAIHVFNSSVLDGCRQVIWHVTYYVGCLASILKVLEHIPVINW